MLTIALTGGIGSGKTAVTDLFRELASRSEIQDSLTIIDADIIARSLLAGSLNDVSINTPDTTVKAVHKLFGPDLFDSKGYLQRDKLRSLIFSSKDKKQQLEALLHPLVYNEIFCRISDIRANNTIASQKAKTNIVIISIPLLFETKAEADAEAKFGLNFDRILVIDVPVKLQIERSSKRDNSSAELLKKIINSQVDRQVRLNQADDIIDNSGTLSELKLKVASLFKYYCSLAAKS